MALLASEYIACMPTWLNIVDIAIFVSLVSWYALTSSIMVTRAWLCSRLIPLAEHACNSNLPCRFIAVVQSKSLSPGVRASGDDHSTSLSLLGALPCHMITTYQFLCCPVLKFQLISLLCLENALGLRTNTSNINTVVVRHTVVSPKFWK